MGVKSELPKFSSECLNLFPERTRILLYSGPIWFLVLKRINLDLYSGKKIEAKNQILPEWNSDALNVTGVFIKVLGY